MSAATNIRRVTRVLLPAFVVSIMLSLMVSGVAAARPTYDGPFARHAKAKKHVKAKKKKRRARASATTVVYDLCATAGDVTPAGAPGAIPVWSFVIKPPAGCADISAAATLPAPTLDVGLDDAVTLNVENTLPDDLTMAIPGVAFAPGSTTIPAGGSGSVSFTAHNPGTYLYESLGDAGRQAEVGLAGPLIVRSGTPGHAYDAASSAYDSERLMVLAEIDPDLNAATLTPGALASYDMATWAPKYRLINGRAYPDTGTISAAAGDKVLLRYVNAGSEHVPMTMLGLGATIVGRDASLLTAPLGFTSETIPAGSTADAIITVPAGASPGDRFAIYDRHVRLVNGASAGIGGRIRFIEVP